jgi:hypothetical protein
MGKMIIEARDGISDSSALDYVLAVTQDGRISGNSYCYVTVFHSGVVVSARRNKLSDKFIVYKRGNNV